MTYEAWTGMYKCPNPKHNPEQHWFYDLRPEMVKCYKRGCNGALVAKLQGELKFDFAGPKSDPTRKRKQISEISMQNLSRKTSRMAE
jgi:hypothetical protein